MESDAVSALLHYENKGYTFIGRNLDGSLAICNSETLYDSKQILNYQELNWICNGAWFELSAVLERLIGIPNSVFSDVKNTKEVKECKKDNKREITILHKLISDLRHLSFYSNAYTLVLDRDTDNVFPLNKSSIIEREGYDLFIRQSTKYYKELIEYYTGNMSDDVVIINLIVFLQDTLIAYLEGAL